MKNIHVLPTDKPTWLHKSLISGILRKSSSCINDMRQSQGMYIYITSDEEIKEGDWVLDLDLKKIVKADKLKVITSKKSKCWYYKKIILTTDQDLIKDGVQAIDDEFLEWFVKNPSCEFVKVYYKCDKSGCYLKEWNTCCREAKPVLTLFAENESKAKYFREPKVSVYDLTNQTQKQHY